MSIFDTRWNSYISPEDYDTWNDLDPDGFLSLDDKRVLNLVRESRIKDLLLIAESRPDLLSSLGSPEKLKFITCYAGMCMNIETEVLLEQFCESFKNFGKSPVRLATLLGTMSDRVKGHKGKILCGHCCMSMESLEVHNRLFPGRMGPIVPGQLVTSAPVRTSFSFYTTWLLKRTIFRDRQRSVWKQKRKRDLIDSLYSFFDYPIPEDALSIIVDFTGWVDTYKEPKNKVMLVQYEQYQFLLIKELIKPECLEDISRYTSRLGRHDDVIIDVNNVLI